MGRLYAYIEASPADTEGNSMADHDPMADVAQRDRPVAGQQRSACRCLSSVPSPAGLAHLARA